MMVALLMGKKISLACHCFGFATEWLLPLRVRSVFKAAGANCHQGLLKAIEISKENHLAQTKHCPIVLQTLGIYSLKCLLALAAASYVFTYKLLGQPLSS